MYVFMNAVCTQKPNIVISFILVNERKIWGLRSVYCFCCGTPVSSFNLKRSKHF